MKLVYEKTGVAVKVDDTVLLHGLPYAVASIAKPHNPNSTGRVYLRYGNRPSTQGYFPSVIDANWIDREDQ